MEGEGEDENKQGFDRIMKQMAELIRTRDEELPPDDRHPSDAIIPHADLSLEETRELMACEGLPAA